MKLLNITFAAAAFLTLSTLAVPAQITKETPKPKFDAELAKKLGADKYGMKAYVFAVLKTGPKDKQIQGEERKKLFAGHLANINRLADEGKLVVAGPFGDNKVDFRGLFILNVKTIEEAKLLTDTDPTIKAGILIVDLIPWYGSAALSELYEIDKKIAEESF